MRKFLLKRRGADHYSSTQPKTEAEVLVFLNEAMYEYDIVELVPRTIKIVRSIV